MVSVDSLDSFFLLPNLALIPRMARLELLFLQSEIARHTNLKRVWFLSYHHMPESIFRKSLGCRWDQTRAACVTSGRFIHYAIASRACPANIVENRGLFFFRFSNLYRQKDLVVLQRL